MIKEVVKFDADPMYVYEMLIDERKHSEFTNSSAKIEAAVGKKFSVWDGYATGVTKELVPGVRIVQSWRASDWPDEAISEVKFEFKKSDQGCVLEFEHSGVPKNFEDEIKNGWRDFYWRPMAKYINDHA